MSNQNTLHNYSQDYLRKKRENLEQVLEHNDERNMKADRTKYITYLESQLDRVSAASLTAQATKERNEQLWRQVSDMEEKIMNLTRLVKVSQQMYEKREEDINQSVSGITHKVNSELKQMKDQINSQNKEIHSLQKNQKGFKIRMNRLENDSKLYDEHSSTTDGSSTSKNWSESENSSNESSFKHGKRKTRYSGKKKSKKNKGISNKSNGENPNPSSEQRKEQIHQNTEEKDQEDYFDSNERYKNMLNYIFSDKRFIELQNQCYYLNSGMEEAKNDIQEVIALVEWNHEQQQRLLAMYEPSPEKQNDEMSSSSASTGRNSKDEPKNSSDNQNHSTSNHQWQEEFHEQTQDQISKLRSVFKKLHQRHLQSLSKVGEIDARLSKLEQNSHHTINASKEFDPIDYTKKICDAYTSTVSEHLQEFSSRLDDNTRKVRSCESQITQFEDDVDSIRKNLDSKIDNIQGQVSRIEETTRSLPSSISSSSSHDTKSEKSSEYTNALKNTENNLKKLSKMMEKSHKHLHTHVCDVEKYALQLGKEMSSAFDERIRETISGIENKMKENIEQENNGQMKQIRNELERLKIAFHSELDNMKRLREEMIKQNVITKSTNEMTKMQLQDISQRIDSLDFDNTQEEEKSEHKQENKPLDNYQERRTTVSSFSPIFNFNTSNRNENENTDISSNKNKTRRKLSFSESENRK